MKHFLLMIFLLAALLPNCKKEQIIIKTPDPTDTTKHIIAFGQGSILKNAALWDASFVVYYYGLGSKSRVQLRIKKEYSGGLRESFFIKDIPSGLGRYTIKRGHTASELGNDIPDSGFTMANYDEGIGNFHPDTTRTDNFIEILHCDTIANEVEGRFQVFMGKIGGPSTLPGVPDSIFLTEGKFYLKIQ